MLFALFFGAGNLIFPLHLGQLSGSNWLQAGLGFLITAVVLPLLSVLAIAITRADGVYGIGLPLGPAFATVFMVLIHATIGPFFGTPRTATVSFTVGLAPLIPAQHQKTGLLIFTTVFFIAAFALAYKENDILSNLGKILNPLFLVLLFIFFLVAFLSPLGSAAAHGPQNAAYLASSGALARGFLEGYNTMDALAGLAFGVTIVTTIKLMGMEEERKVAGVTAQSGFLAMGAVGVIYILLIIIGAMSLNRFPLSENGGVAFSQIVQAYAGTVGQAFLATLITLTCLTTAVGLVAAFGQDFHKRFPKVSYHVWLALSCLLSFTVANFGLDTIISWSTPVLMLLYPYCIALILLSVFSPPFRERRHGLFLGGSFHHPSGPFGHGDHGSRGHQPVGLRPLLLRTAFPLAPGFFGTDLADPRPGRPVHRSDRPPEGAGDQAIEGWMFQRKLSKAFFTPFKASALADTKMRTAPARMSQTHQ